MKEDFEKEGRSISYTTNKQAELRTGSKKKYFPYIVRRNFSRLTQEIAIPNAIELSTAPSHDTLSQEIWKDDVLKNNIRHGLLKIAKAFYDYLKIDAKIKDIIFTGSLANYNWTTQSDIDLHILLNLDTYGEDREFIEEYLIAKKTLWNEKHNIKIKGFEVELFPKAEEKEFDYKTIYSVLNNQWIKKPVKGNVGIDEDAIREKVAELMNDIDDLNNIQNEEKRLAKADAIKDKIVKMRNAGLEDGGEFSVENMVFKTLRKNGYLEKVGEIKSTAFDKSLSIDEKQQLNESFVISENKRKNEFSCLMCDFNIPKWDKLEKMILPEDLYTEEEGLGFEEEPHITVLYGLHDDVKVDDVRNTVKETMGEQKDVVAELAGISMFENEKFDVLKFDVVSNDLKKLNKAVTKFPYTSDYPDYVPHMTIAYLKAGTGKKYCKKFKEPVVLKSSGFTYSDPYGKKVEFKVGKNKITLGIEKNIEGMTSEKIELLKKFIIFTINKLGIEKPVSIYLHKGRDEYITTTASYIPSEDSNHIRVGGRALVDCMRSIGHEIRHMEQMEKGLFKLGEATQTVGGFLEDDANAIAGILIKDFALNYGNDRIYEL